MYLRLQLSLFTAFTTIVQSIVNSSAGNIAYISKYCVLWASFGHFPAKPNSNNEIRSPSKNLANL